MMMKPEQNVNILFPFKSLFEILMEIDEFRRCTMLKFYEKCSVLGNLISLSDWFSAIFRYKTW